jgi:hypothetical protein
MQKIFTSRSLTVWIACCAILLNALMPSISHALAASQASSPNSYAESNAEICTSTGIKTIVINNDNNDDKNSIKPAPTKLKPSAHCAYCLTHDGSVGLPPDILSFPLRAVSYALLPRLFYQAPAAPFSWSVTLSRAPPVIA